MTTEKERHRLTVEVDKDVYDELRDHIPWGSMKPVINIMLKNLLELCRKHDSKMVLGAILSEKITLKEYLKNFTEEETE